MLQKITFHSTVLTSNVDLCSACCLSHIWRSCVILSWSRLFCLFKVAISAIPFTKPGFRFTYKKIRPHRQFNIHLRVQSLYLVRWIREKVRVQRSALSSFIHLPFSNLNTNVLGDYTEKFPQTCVQVRKIRSVRRNARKQRFFLSKKENFKTPFWRKLSTGARRVVRNDLRFVS